MLSVEPRLHGLVGTGFGRRPAQGSKIGAAGEGERKNKREDGEEAEHGPGSRALAKNTPPKTPCLKRGQVKTRKNTKSMNSDQDTSLAHARKPGGN